MFFAGMLLCAINDIKAGMVLGAQVTDPRAPDLRLLLPGVTLDASLIAVMKARGICEAWVVDDLTSDLDAAVASELTGARLEVYTRLRDNLAGLSRSTVSTASVHSYRQAVMGLVTQAISSGQYASLTGSLFAASEDLATHGANVAYLSVLCGLHAEAYLVSEQPRLERTQAREMSVLGLAGLLHDIGKTRAARAARHMHEAHGAEESGPPRDSEEYQGHVVAGRELLETANAPARVTHTILNHHQRFDGRGWPDMTTHTAGRFIGPLRGKRIHIYARVVAAANVLDNLLRDAEGRRPPAAALHAFASARFDGWFDPVVRRAMLMRIPPFAVGVEVRLSDGSRGVVVAPAKDPREPCRPSVRVLADNARKRDGDSRTLDLQQCPELFITHALGEEVAPFLYSAPPAAEPSAESAGAIETPAEAAS